MPTFLFGGGSIDCKLDFITIRSNLTVKHFIMELLEPVIVPHFENHPPASQPLFMDNNARPHRSRTVQANKRRSR